MNWNELKEGESYNCEALTADVDDYGVMQEPKITKGVGELYLNSFMWRDVNGNMMWPVKEEQFHKLKIV